MPIELTRAVATLRMARDAARPWIRWWTDELRSLWNDILDRMLPSARVLTEIRPHDGALVLVQRRGQVVLATHTLTETFSTLPETPAELPEGVAGTRAVLFLPPAEVLIKRLRLPAAIEPRLRESLALRLDREMPLKAELVYSDCAIAERRAEDASIDVDLAIARRSCVDGWERRVRELSLRPSAIGVSGEGDAALRFNFLRGRALARSAAGPAHRWDRPLAASAALLALIVVANLGWQWRSERRSMDVAIASLSATAQTAEAARKELLHHLDTAQELRTDLERPALGAVLADLTRGMAPDTWIQNLQFKGDEIQLSGIGPNAPALVAQLERSPLFERVSLTSTVSAGLGTGEDRFELEAYTQAVVR